MSFFVNARETEINNNEDVIALITSDRSKSLGKRALGYFAKESARIKNVFFPIDRER